MTTTITPKEAKTVAKEIFRLLRRKSGEGELVSTTVQLLRSDLSPASFLHDIPLKSSLTNSSSSSYPIYNMVVEIPRGTSAKMEISIKSHNNPIVQDTKKGKLRFIKDTNQFQGYPVNYGALPRTFESPSSNILSKLYSTNNTTTDYELSKEELALRGDSDPLDVLDISKDLIYHTGSVVPIKILGILPMIDEGELDLKAIAISIESEHANSFETLKDVEKKWPGYLASLHDFYRDYKKPDSESSFFRDPMMFDHDESERIIEIMHKEYYEYFGIKEEQEEERDYVFPLEYKAIDRL